MKATATMCKCGKCGGSGFLPEYRGIRSGICFSCKGSGEYEASCRTWYQINGLFWIKAKDEKTALAKANKKYEGKGTVAVITGMNVR